MTAISLTNAKRIAKRLGMGLEVRHDQEGLIALDVDTTMDPIPHVTIYGDKRLALVGFIAACEAIEAEVKKGKK
jgi:hypothetical protein